MSPTVVRAVRARHQLLVRCLVWKVRFQIILLRRSQVQCSRRNPNNPVPQPKALIKLLARRNHLLKHLPTLPRIRNHKLFHLFKLVHSKNSPHVSSRRPCFLAETRRVSRILDWKLRVWALEPLVRVQRRDRLLGRRNQVLFIIRRNDLQTLVSLGSNYCLPTYLVQLLVKLLKLRRLAHLVLVHHKRWLNLLVPLLAQKVESVGYERLVEIHSVVNQIVAAVSCHLGPCTYACIKYCLMSCHGSIPRSRSIASNLRSTS